MNAPDQHQLGLYNKFNITRTDGKDAPGERHHGDEYFVLNLTTDKNSIPAIAAYADACEAKYPLLAADLRAKVAAAVSSASIFVTVPEVTLPNGLVVPSFSAAKYLASRGVSGVVQSTEDGAPWVRINYYEARKACADSGYALITESRALAIAYDISLQDINWSGGKVGEGSIYQGIHKGNVSEAQDATYESGDAEERRWHELSNGERIYDFAGNAYTWVFDDVQGDSEGLTTVINVDSPSLTTAPFPSMQKGMGWRPDSKCDWSGRALIRGGYWCSESDAGVFYLDLGWRGNGGDFVGFRCTK